MRRTRMLHVADEPGVRRRLIALVVLGKTLHIDPVVPHTVAAKRIGHQRIELVQRARKALAAAVSWASKSALRNCLPCRRACKV